MGTTLSGLQRPDRTGLPYQVIARENTAEPEASRPNLLVCPWETLHVSLAWLLAVHASYPVAKDSLRERYGEEWTTDLRRIAAQSTGFRITYEHVVATDSAVIALAQPSEPVNRIRETISERLRLPPETRNEADLVHTTLFRYRGAFSAPKSSLLCSRRTRAPTPRPRSTSWSSRGS